MKFSRVTLACLAVVTTSAEAFGIQRAVHRATTLTDTNRRNLSVTSFGEADPHPGNKLASRMTKLQMTSDSNGENKVTIDKDFRLSAIFLVGGLLLDQIPYLQITLGPVVTLLGVLFLVQTFRLNFVCDDSTFSLEQSSSEETGENIVVGGENRWTYDSFVNYDFFPSGWIDEPQGPILVYFKETQTPSGKKIT